MLERVLLYTEVFVGRKPEIQRKKVKKAMHLRDTRSAVLSDRHFMLSSRKTKGMRGGAVGCGSGTRGYAPANERFHGLER